MKYILASVLIFIAAAVSGQALTSPDKKLTLIFTVDAGKPVYSIRYANDVVITNSSLGLITNQDNFSQSLKLVKSSPVIAVADSYSMLNAKKEQITYTANKKTYTLSNNKNKLMVITFQVSNDGVAFRYEVPSKSKETITVVKEHTSYNFSPATKAWLQHKAAAQTGWEHTNPSYEEDYQQNISVGTKSETGWVYPALFKVQNTWLAITETGMDGSYCGTFLRNEAGSAVYTTSFPDQREIFTGRGLLPTFKGTVHTPWRIIAIGSLKSLTESTLGTDLAIPAMAIKNPKFIKPGKASWSWIMSKDDAIVYDEQKKYIDFAALMNWQYCLIDVNWDTKIGYDKIAELSAYAKTKSVGLILWYNSAGDWNTVPYHPKNKMLTHESRVAEFSRLQSMGIKGVKIDFFNGDGQSMIQYYTDILKDAANYDLLVNFHGATLPRGWARTYPHLMTTEAVKGFENVTFTQPAADAEPGHGAMLPFTRNLFDPMDYTPMNLYKIQSNVIRKTSSAYELATGVLYLSGIQHYAESPEGMTHVPQYVQDYLRSLPNHWQDVKFIDGMPGKFAVFARRSGKKWYVAGINGEANPIKLSLDLSELKKTQGMIITDGTEALSFIQQQITLPANQKTEVTIAANGGFVMVLE